MELGDLLHMLRSNILHDRSHRVSGDDDQLWSDATLITYIDEAQRKLAREGLVIRDGTTPAAVTVDLQAGVAQYDLHPSVIAVVSARQGEDAVDLVRAGHALLDTYGGSSAQRILNPEHFTMPVPGKPRIFTTDEHVVSNDRGSMGVVSLRLYPAPSEDALDPVHLRVIRMPIRKLTASDMCMVPEVPEEYHLEMLDWAAYLALRIADVDAGMPKRALEFRSSFELMVRQAKRETMRKLFAPQGWCFGQGGFVWGR